MAKISLNELWQLFRGMENASRYYADIISSAMSEFPDNEAHRIDIGDVSLEGLHNWGGGRCIPPWCIKGMEDLDAEMREFARKASALAGIMKTLTGELLNLRPPVNNLKHYASEKPGVHWPES